MYYNMDSEPELHILKSNHIHIGSIKILSLFHPLASTHKSYQNHNIAKSLLLSLSNSL